LTEASTTITLGADQYPPVNAFWSVTMYAGKTQLLIKNAINRSSSTPGWGGPQKIQMVR
jgi:hypothetical protein